MVGFDIHWHESATGVHVSLIPKPSSYFPPHPMPLGCPSVLALSSLFHVSDLDWLSISHMIIYMFQCYSLKSSHPCLLPQSPKVCSLYLCLFHCLIYKVIITIFLNSISSFQFSSGAQSCPTFCDPMNCSTPGLPVHHQLLEFTQTHVHQVSDAIQPSHPLLSPYSAIERNTFESILISWVKLEPIIQSEVS